MTKRQKIVLYRILSAAALLILASLFPLSGIPRLIVFLIPYGIIGYDVLWSAVRNIINGQVFDENFLMAIATVGAFCVGEYPEGVAVMLFYQIGELFQSIAVGKSRKSIAALMDIRPDTATVLRNGEEVTLSPEDVAVDEILIVRPGEKIPLDGIVTDGATSVDTAALTGESLPQEKERGDAVISGSVNLNGVIQVKVTKVFGESTVSKILELVENSATKKAKAEQFITRFARWYTPCVVIGALLLAVIPPLFVGGWSDWIHRALIFLVVSCPCALVISVPLSFFGGIGGASRKGILIKGANYLEALAKVETVVFDKTGTLTKGSFSVAEICPENLSEQELLTLVAYGESYSNHPIAQSILNAYGKPIDQSRIENAEELSGKGIRATVNGKTIWVGNDKLMAMAGVALSEHVHNGSTVHIAVEKTYAGHLVIADELKADAKTAIQTLKNVGIRRSVMLTGDMEGVAASVAEDLQIDEYRAQLLPHQKVEEVERLLNEKQGGVLVFVGDGINDAPVLTRADVGIAMGALGSDAAIEAADVVLMDDQPAKIAEAIRIARKTMSIVRQNILFALSVKGLVLLLGAIGIAGMWLAVFADVGVMVIAILNAMRAVHS
ncbi:MAG: cadmium-translocating P-type ATPase, partial [Clostridia bacterium]|nr:cadmium-translocating P-type ATPase [Clostridia bacterium]